MSFRPASEIPHYVVADSPRGLQRRMFRLNARLGFPQSYFDIQQAKDGKWYAWYFAQVKGMDKRQEMLKGESGGES